MIVMEVSARDRWRNRSTRSAPKTRRRGSTSHSLAPRHPCPQCLHRFCSECIQKCLRVGRKECPSCRIHVPSRRSLRYDTNFDAVIGKIYPNLDE